jgi:hypothetical protein
MLINTPAGNVFTMREYRECLKEAGFKKIATIPAPHASPLIEAAVHLPPRAGTGALSPPAVSRERSSPTHRAIYSASDFLFKVRGFRLREPRVDASHRGGRHETEPRAFSKNRRRMPGCGERRESMAC